MSEFTGRKKRVKNGAGKVLFAGNLTVMGIVSGWLLSMALPLSGVNAEAKMTLFVSTGCPHCIKVREFIDEYGIEDKVVVWNVHTDDGAAEKYTDFVAEHEIPPTEQGTPTLIYDESKYVVGDTPIIDFLAERYELQENNHMSDDISDDDDSMFTVGDYVLFGIGLIVVLSIVGYGIVRLENGRGKS